MKPTKKEIQKVLRTLDVTQIHRIAFLCGVNTDSKSDVYNFIKQFAPTNRVYSLAFKLSYGRTYQREYKIMYANYIPLRLPIADCIRFARQQKTEGKSNYSKILIEGFKNIYWAHPIYQHTDYNKSIALSNTEENRKIMKLINKYLAS